MDVVYVNPSNVLDPPLTSIRMFDEKGDTVHGG